MTTSPAIHRLRHTLPAKDNHAPHHHLCCTPIEGDPVIGRIAAGVAMAVVVLLAGCAGVIGAILGLGGGDTTSTTSSCLALLDTGDSPAPAAAASPPDDVPASPPPPDDSIAPPAGIAQCLDCLQSPTPTASPSPTSGCRNTVELARAASWLTAWHGAPVPYLSSPNPITWFDGYRRDCSGYVSMALGLPGPGLDTTAMAARFTPINKDDLQPGDLLIRPGPDLTGHVVIFDRWADPDHTTYLGYEQSGDGGTHHRTIPYPYYGNYPMTPYAPIDKP